jgi:hypothetical protein
MRRVSGSSHPLACEAALRADARNVGLTVTVDTTVEI